MATAEVRRYWSRLVDMGCVARLDKLQPCGAPAEIAHCHDGSVVERMMEPRAKGKKLARYDWLVLPLCPRHHRHGRDALDNGVKSWERRFGTQAGHVDRLIAETGIDVWAKANEGRK